MMMTRRRKKRKRCSMRKKTMKAQRTRKMQPKNKISIKKKKREFKFKMNVNYFKGSNLNSATSVLLILEEMMRHMEIWRTFPPQTFMQAKSFSKSNKTVLSHK